MSEKIKATIEKVRVADNKGEWSSTAEGSLLAAPGSYIGARLSGLSATQTGFLRLLGVVGTNGGLTAHGAAVRAVLDREALDRDFPL